MGALHGGKGGIIWGAGQGKSRQKEKGQGCDNGHPRQGGALHGPVNGVHLCQSVGLRRHRVLLRRAEDLHLPPTGRQVPSGGFTVVLVGLLPLRGAWVKFRGGGKVGDGEMEPLWLYAAVAPEIGPRLFHHPALGGHFLQVGLDARVVKKGEGFKAAFRILHVPAPPVSVS